MAVASSIMTSQDDDTNNNTNTNTNNNAENDPNKDDHHEQDMVMPGFRFHPTEEELIEFYLRRKVEGKRFNVELITFLDLYRYDPWELPALAAIGEKEWFFYVPRDRKYRNGDRPNRVTTSGYWKATGADRMIRTETFRSIGLKKTLVFYSGKAPKGIRTSWIMNEYRLPQHETERLQKAEISLCRVYKRAGVEDHPSLPRSLPTRASSSSSARGNLNHHASISSASKNKAASNSRSPNVSMEASFQQLEEKLSDTSGSSSNDHLHHHHHHHLSLAAFSKNDSNNFISLAPMTATTALSSVSAPLNMSPTLALPENNPIFTGASSIDDLHRLVNFQQYYHSNNPNQSSQLMFSSLLQQTPLPLPLSLPPQSSLALNSNILPTGNIPANFTDRLWDWNSINEGSKDHFNSPFK